jgi:hypothetical protein
MSTDDDKSCFALENVAHGLILLTGVSFFITAAITLVMDVDQGMLESSVNGTTNYYNIFHRSYTDTDGETVSTDIQCGNSLELDGNSTHCNLYDTELCGVMQAGSLVALIGSMLVIIISAFNLGRSKMLGTPKTKWTLIAIGLSFLAFIFLSIILGEFDRLHDDKDKCFDDATLEHGSLFTLFVVFYAIGLLLWLVHVIAIYMIYRKSTNGDYNSMLLAGGY